MMQGKIYNILRVRDTDELAVQNSLDEFTQAIGEIVKFPTVGWTNVSLKVVKPCSWTYPCLLKPYLAGTWSNLRWSARACRNLISGFQTISPWALGNWRGVRAQ